MRRSTACPADFGKIANTQILGLQIPVIVMILGILVLALVMARTSYGMRIYAVGGNPVAAQIAGVKTGRILFSVYALSGLLAGLSGVMLASRVISGPPNLGQGYELDAIAAVVIGGASLLGGRGSIWGTALGLLLIQTLNNGLDILVVPAYWQSVIKGVLIVAAVAVDVWSARRHGSSPSTARVTTASSLESKWRSSCSTAPCACSPLTIAAAALLTTAACGAGDPNKDAAGSGASSNGKLRVGCQRLRHVARSSPPARTASRPTPRPTTSTSSGTRPTSM